MPHRFVVDRSRRLVYNRFTGKIRVEDFVVARNVVIQDPSFDPAFDVIVDLRSADLVALSSDNLRALAGGTAFRASARRAFVADDDMTFGLSRMYEIFRELLGGRERIEVFKTLEDALAWLGVHGFDPPTVSSE